VIRARLLTYALTISIGLFLVTGKTVAAEGNEASQKIYRLGKLALLQPDSLIGTRVSAADIVSTTNAIVSITERWSSGLDTAHSSNECTIFVALRPKQRIKTWTSCKTFEASDLDNRIALELKPEHIARTKGLVLFAMHGKSSDENAFPDAWKAQLDGAKETVVMSDIVDQIWPE
jgi:hypothetical protein